MGGTVEAIIHHLAPAPKRSLARFNTVKIFASWQSGLETLSGYGQLTLHLQLAPRGEDVISRTEAVGQRHTTLLSLQVERPSFRLIRSLEREITNHLRSVTGKSCEREMAALQALPMLHVMKTNAVPKMTDEIRSYVQLQRQIHNALRVEHPEWVEPNGDCPTCESYESRLAELLGVSSRTKIKRSPS
jgi:hypothetical protein